MNDFKKGNFVNDAEKMRDFHRLTKEEFLQSYSYLTEEEYDNTSSIVNANLDYAKLRIRLVNTIISVADVLNPLLENDPIIADSVVTEFSDELNVNRDFIYPIFVKRIDENGYFCGSIADYDNVFYGEWCDYNLTELTTTGLLRLIDYYKSIV